MDISGYISTNWASSKLFFLC